MYLAAGAPDIEVVSVVAVHFRRAPSAKYSRFVPLVLYGAKMQRFEDDSDAATAVHVVAARVLCNRSPELPSMATNSPASLGLSHWHSPRMFVPRSSEWTRCVP